MCCKGAESSAGSVSNSASMSRQSSWVELFSDVAALEMSLTLQVTSLTHTLASNPNNLTVALS